MTPYARDAVSWAVAEGLIRGIADSDVLAPRRLGDPCAGRHGAHAFRRAHGAGAPSNLFPTHGGRLRRSFRKGREPVRPRPRPVSRATCADSPPEELVDAA